MHKLLIYWIWTQYWFKICPLVWIDPLIIYRVKLLHCIEQTYKGSWKEKRISTAESCFFVTLYYPLRWAVCQKTGWKSPASNTWDYAFLASQPWVMAHLAERFQEGTPLLPKHKPFNSSPFTSPRALRPWAEGVGEHERKNSKQHHEPIATYPPPASYPAQSESFLSPKPKYAEPPGSALSAKQESRHLDR